MRHIALTAVLLLSGTLTVAQDQPAESEHRVITSAEQKFAAVANVPECAKAMALRGDPGQGAFVLHVKSAGACTIPWHWHTANEQLMIASGSARLTSKGEAAAQRLATGAYAYLPSKHVHQFVCPGACSFFLVSDAKFDIHYVDQAGAEIPMAEAVAKARQAGKGKRPAGLPPKS